MERDERPQPQVWRAPPDQLQDEERVDHTTLGEVVALDAVTEAKVNAALDEVMRGRTTFVIAHRLSTIRNATRILVFDNGRVIENGTFDELVARGGRFAELARAQFMVQENAREGARASVKGPDSDHTAVKA